MQAIDKLLSERFALGNHRTDSARSRIERVRDLIFMFASISTCEEDLPGAAFTASSVINRFRLSHRHMLSSNMCSNFVTFL